MRYKLTAGLMTLCAALEKKSTKWLLNLQCCWERLLQCKKKASFMGYRDSENAINRQSSNII
jgi:hypothetical protein